MLELFNRFDTNKNGTLDIKELDKCLKDGGYNFTPEQVVMIMRIVDADDSGTLDLNEFLDLIAYLYVIDLAFYAIDSNRNGKIERNELKRALKDVGYKFTDSQINVFFKMVDEDNSGTIEIEEFHTLSLFLREAKVLFSIADADGSGSVSFDEFKKFLPILGIKVPADKAKEIYGSLTTTKDKLSFEEFVNFVFVLLYA